MNSSLNPLRNLVVVFGDQLNLDAACFDDFDAQRDAVWMAEVEYESKHVWSSKPRIAFFLSAMRHFREELSAKGWTVYYTELPQAGAGSRFSSLLKVDIERLQPDKVLFVEPGEWRLQEEIGKLLKEIGVAHDCLPDRHFFLSREAFGEYCGGRKSLRMEFFYRMMRKQTGILMGAKGEPEGGAWNFDAENRGSFGRDGPPEAHTGPDFIPDKITREVLELVAESFADHPGELAEFRWPVGREACKKLLKDFVEKRLPHFGEFQDAMWQGEPWLYHSWVSAALNVKLLDPREVCETAEKAYREGKAPLPAVEGFIRQILGWREYVRGIYWQFMPEYLNSNALNARSPLPAFYWDGDTEYACLKATIGQTLKYGYAHHIQRLMVTGLYAMLLGVEPRQIHEWYLAVYVDAVEWVEMPNVIGMSQYADGGIMASKPYAATGKYIQRMSNYCSQCPKNPALKVGKDACPFTTLYWDFLDRHREKLSHNQRMSLQVRNLERLSATDRKEIRNAADQLGRVGPD